MRISGGRRRSGVIKLILLTLVMTALSAALAGGASAATCSPFKFIGAAGSGERTKAGISANRGVGSLLYKLYGDLTDGNGVPRSKIPLSDVDYPAVSVKPENLETIGNAANALDAAGLGFGAGGFWDSVKKGGKDLADQIKKHSDGPCKSKTKLIIAGYSQGALVVRLAYLASTKEMRKTIAQLVVFGDPFFTNHSEAYGDFEPLRTGALIPAGVHDEFVKLVALPKGAPLLSLCNKGDIFCQLTRPAFNFYGGPYIYDWNGQGVANHTLSDPVGYEPNGLMRLAKAMISNRLKLKALAPVPVADQVRGTAADIAFVMDTTGSMGDEIDDARDAVADIAAKLATAAPDFRVALTEFKDDEDDFQSRVVVPFTGDLNALSAGLNLLDADGGGDTPESVYAGIESALHLGFRPGAKKFVIVIGDAEPKDPEPVTGSTWQSVRTSAFNLGPAKVYGIYPWYAATDEGFQPLRDLISSTGGQLLDLYGGTPLSGAPKSLGAGGSRTDSNTAPARATFAVDDALSTAIITAITQGTAAPVVKLATPGIAWAGSSIPVSASVLSGESATTYEWDFDGNGSYDAVGPSRTQAVPLSRVGSTTIVVRATFADGAVAFGSGTVNVQPAATIVKSKKLVGKVSGAKAKSKRKRSTISFSYKHKATTALVSARVLNAKGRVVGSAKIKAVAKKSNVKIIVPGALKRGRYRIQIVVFQDNLNGTVASQKKLASSVRVR